MQRLVSGARSCGCGLCGPRIPRASAGPMVGRTGFWGMWCEARDPRSSVGLLVGGPSS